MTTTPANSRTTSDGNRTYTWRGETFWSVTTILRAIAKPALVPWAARSVAEAAVQATRTGTLQAMVDQDPDGAVSFLKQSPYSQRDQAAGAGSLIHQWVEARIIGATTPDVPVGLRPTLEQFQRFEAENAPQWEASEVTVYSREHEYAGTLDAICVVNGKRFIVDFKTGKGVYPEYALQLNAYAHGEFIGLPNGTEQQLPPLDGAIVIHLGPRSLAVVDVALSDEQWDAFTAAKRVWEWMNDGAKRAFMADVP